MIQTPNCKRFSGYKPCEPFKDCLNCPDLYPFDQSILLINLDALGDVLVTTAVLAGIKRKYPTSTIHWLTRANAVSLLENNPYIDHLWTWNDDNRLILTEMQFEVLFNADKNKNSCAFVNRVSAKDKYGFGINQHGAIIPLNRGAEYNYRVGLNDWLKFKVNSRSGQDILAETFEIPYHRDEYVLCLTDFEKRKIQDIRRDYGIRDKDFVVGFNTGCSQKQPNKKLRIDQHIELINRLNKRLPAVKILLLGGKEDTERNAAIKTGVSAEVISTPTEEGLRRGVLYVAVCDLVVSGDTLGMHIGIALKKNIVAWFGWTSHAEIDLYDRGEKIIISPYNIPFWNPALITGSFAKVRDLNYEDFVAAIERIYRQWQQKNELDEG